MPSDDFKNGSIPQNILSDFANIIATQPTAKFASGARCTIKVNGKPFAFATQVSWNISTAQTEIRTIDDYLPYEFAPSMVSVEGSISGLHVPGFGPSAELFQSDVLSFLFHKYINIEVRDRTTNTLLFFAGKAVITNRSESIPAEGPAQITLNFKAIGWRDEQDPTFPEGYNQTKPTEANNNFLDKVTNILRRRF